MRAPRVVAESRSLRRLSLVLAGLAALAGCTHLEPPDTHRPRRSLPEEWVRPYRPRHPGFNFRLEPAPDHGRDYRSYAFRFDAYSEVAGDFHRVEGVLYRSLRIPPGERGPLLLISPILAGDETGYIECRVFARWAGAYGISAFYIHQEEHVLSADRDGVGLEQLIRDNIQDNLRALDLLLERPEVDPLRLATLGISLGAIKNVVLAAVEPRFVGNVLCLAGADVPRILLESQERGVLRYIARREEREGLSREEISEDVGRFLVAEPARYAPFIPGERTLLFLGSLDDKVPYETGLVLREKLGEPETYIIPLGHYTGMLAAPYAASKMFEYLHRRFRSSDPASPPALGD